jgi:6-phosphogluconolactonase
MRYFMMAVVFSAMAQALGTGAALRPGKLQVYIGTYTDHGSKGIYRAELDLATGQLSSPTLAGATDSPSFLVLHPNHKLLYAVNEVDSFEGKKNGSVSAFAIDGKTGALTLLNRQPSEGGGPCYVSLDKAGRHALVANYGGGTVTVLPIDAEGRLGPATCSIQHTGSSVKKEQKRPHAHSIDLDPSNRFAVASDLGIDKRLVYRFDEAKGVLLPNAPPDVALPPGSGPRHFAFHPGGAYAYGNNELDSTVTAYRYDATKGTLEAIQTLSTVPADFKEHNDTAETQVSADGRFVYVSNRGHDSIAIFSVDEKTGRLTAQGHALTKGKEPRHFAIDPTGAYLLAANQNSDTVVVFRIDAKSGALTPTGAVAEVSRPVCVTFVPSGT